MFYFQITNVQHVVGIYGTELISCGSQAAPLHGGGEESIGDEGEVRSLCTTVLLVLPGAVPLQHLKGVEVDSRQLLLHHSQEKVAPSNNYIFQAMQCASCEHFSQATWGW